MLPGPVTHSGECTRGCLRRLITDWLFHFAASIAASFTAINWIGFANEN
jgi:hypothetical protein